MFCDKLFKGIEEKAGSGTQFEVKFSMLEIYNEVARDLLDSAAMKKKAGLKIRQVSFGIIHINDISMSSFRLNMNYLHFVEKSVTKFFPCYNGFPIY